MFWLRPSISAARRALDLARAALLLEPMPEQSRERVGRRVAHPHRVPLRASRARRRGGAVTPRPQPCITPLVRTARCGLEPAGRR